MKEFICVKFYIFLQFNISVIIVMAFYTLIYIIL
uniref:Uncharacterized protein n=1 Tax=Anguilla anguilla TaxID=7936 RepID=A0A0E9SMJ3_ANGAN